MKESNMKPAKLWLRDTKDLLYSSKSRKGDSVIRTPPVKADSDDTSVSSPMTRVEEFNASSPTISRNPSVIRKNTQSCQDPEMVPSKRQDSEPLPKKRRLLELVDYNDNHHVPNTGITSVSSFNASENVNTSPKRNRPNNQEFLNGTLELANEDNLNCNCEKTTPTSDSLVTINNSGINSDEEDRSIPHSSVNHKVSLPSSLDTIKLSTSGSGEIISTTMGLMPRTVSAIVHNKSTARAVDNTTTAVGEVVTNPNTVGSLTSSSNLFTKPSTSRHTIPNLMAQRSINELGLPYSRVSSIQKNREIETSIDEFQDILAKACHAVGLDEGLMDISDVPEDSNMPHSASNYEGTGSALNAYTLKEHLEPRPQNYPFHSNKDATYPLKYLNYAHSRYSQDKTQISPGCHLNNQNVKAFRSQVSYPSQNQVPYHYPYRIPYPSHFLPHTLPNAFSHSSETSSNTQTHPYPDPYYYYHHYPQSAAASHPRSYSHFPPQGRRYPWPGTNYPSPATDPKQMHLYYRYPVKSSSVSSIHQTTTTTTTTTPTTENPRDLRPCRFESSPYTLHQQYPYSLVGSKKYPVPSSGSPQGNISPNKQIYYQPRYSPQQTVKTIRPPSVSPQGYPAQRAEYSPVRSPISPVMYNNVQIPSIPRIPTSVDASYHNNTNKSVPTGYPIAPVPVKYSDVEEHRKLSSYQSDQSSDHSWDVNNSEMISNGHNKPVIKGDVNRQGPFVIEKVRQYSYPPYHYSDWKVPTYHSSSESSKNNPNQNISGGLTGNQTKTPITYPNPTNNNFHGMYPEYYKRLPLQTGRSVEYRQTQLAPSHHPQPHQPYPDNSYSVIERYPYQHAPPQASAHRASTNTETNCQEQNEKQMKIQNAVSASLHTSASVISNKCNLTSNSFMATSSTTQTSNSVSSANGLQYKRPVTNLSKSYPVYNRPVHKEQQEQQHNSHYQSGMNSNNYSQENVHPKSRPVEVIPNNLKNSSALSSSSSSSTVPASYSVQLTSPHESQPSFTEPCSSVITSTNESYTTGIPSSSAIINSSTNPANLVNSQSTKPLPENQEMVYPRNQNSSIVEINKEISTSKPLKSCNGDDPIQRPISKPPVATPTETQSSPEKKRPLSHPGEITIGPFILNKGYATFINQSEAENDSLLFKQKLLPVMDHLLSIPEAASLRPLRDSPDELLDHLVRLWGGKGANSTAKDCYQRMKENFVSVVKFLFKPYLLISWGWDKAPPEQILDELLSTSEQGDILSQTTFGNICRQNDSSFVSSRSSSLDDDVFLPSTNFSCSDLSEDVFNYFDGIDTTTGSSEGCTTTNNENLETLGSPASFLFKDVVSNDTLVILSPNDKENGSSTKLNTDSCHITKTSSFGTSCALRVTNKYSSQINNEIQPNLGRVEDMIPCILRENNATSSDDNEIWSSKMVENNYSPNHLLKASACKSRCNINARDTEKYSCGLSSEVPLEPLLFQTNDCCIKSPETKNMKRPSLEDVEKTLDNQLIVKHVSKKISECTEVVVVSDNCVPSHTKSEDTDKSEEEKKAEWQKLTEHLIEYKQAKEQETQENKVFSETSNLKNVNNSGTFINRDLPLNFSVENSIRTAFSKTNDAAMSESTANATNVVTSSERDSSQRFADKQKGDDFSLQSPKENFVPNNFRENNDSSGTETSGQELSAPPQLSDKSQITEKIKTKKIISNSERDFKVKDVDEKASQSDVHNSAVNLNKQLPVIINEINLEKEKYAEFQEKNRNVTLSTPKSEGSISKPEAILVSGTEAEENVTSDIQMASEERQIYSSSSPASPKKDCHKSEMLSHVSDNSSLTKTKKETAYTIPRKQFSGHETYLKKDLLSAKSSDKDFPSDKIPDKKFTSAESPTSVKSPDKKLPSIKSSVKTFSSKKSDGNSREVTKSSKTPVSKEDETPFLHQPNPNTPPEFNNDQTIQKSSLKRRQSTDSLIDRLRLHISSTSKKEFVNGLSPITDYTTIFKKYVESKVLLTDPIEKDSGNNKSKTNDVT